MIFARIIYSAILAGLVTGVLLTSLHQASLQPIIVEAERYENHIDSGSGGNGGQTDHAPPPAGGVHRIARSLVANLLASTGFAAILLASMCLWRLLRGRYISWSRGALWGLAGYAAMFVAPAIGLPPEIPGVGAAAIEHRQLWWLLTAVSVSIGIAIVAFTPARLKALGILLIALPYIVGAPHGSPARFARADAGVTAALANLQQQFIVAAAITNLVFWLVLGLVCRYAFDRWLRGVTPVGGEKRD